MTATRLPAAAADTSPRPARLPALDVLRGLAILGTLLTNIWMFSASRSSAGADAGAASQGDFGSTAGSPVQQAVSTGLDLVTDGKWIGLLTIMFGIGLEIQRQAAIRRGESWPGTYPWRAGLLVVDGMLNYVFIFEFDVLMGYGLTALVVAAVLATSPRAQKVWLGVGLSVHLALITAMSFPALLGMPDEEPEAGGDRLSAAAWKEILALDPQTVTDAQLSALGTRHGVPAAELRTVIEATSALPAGTDSYWAMVQSRLDNVLMGRAEIPLMLTMGLGLFLAGAFLYREGLFEASGARLRRRVMLAAFGIGLPIDLLCRLVFEGVAGMFPRYVTSSLVAFGVLALVAHVYAGGRRPGVVGRGLSAVGRMALTCYILQNLVCSLIFYDYGLGLARRLPAQWTQLGTLGVYVVVAAGLVGGSLAWLRFFSRGPVEITWHRSHAFLVGQVHPPLPARREARRAARAAG